MQSKAATIQKPAADRAAAIRCIDTDVHLGFAGPWKKVLRPYMSRRWRELLTDRESSGFNSTYDIPGETYFYPIPGGGFMQDVVKAGGVPASDPVQAAATLLDRYEIDRGLINPPAAPILNYMPYWDAANAIMAATNDWVIETWLSADPRWRGMIMVNVTDPEWSVKEIARLADTPRMAGVRLNLGKDAMGDKRYWPIYEAASHYGLPIVTHVAVAGVYQTGTTIAGGTAIHYLDWKASLSQPFQTGIATLISTGVFDRFPKLRILFDEIGFAWLPDLMWKMDAVWKGNREFTPWLTKPPSEYIVEHCKFSTQPWIEPKTREHISQILTMCEADRTLVYSSDFPHFDWDEPMVVSRDLPEPMRRRIMVENALELFGDRML